ncbi:Uncharacterised protein [uncultured archaeon]|nr:Uncharacterised protein [uncultured archaeon]
MGSDPTKVFFVIHSLTIVSCITKYNDIYEMKLSLRFGILITIQGDLCGVRRKIINQHLSSSSEMLSTYDSAVYRLYGHLFSKDSGASGTPQKKKINNA